MQSTKERLDDFIKGRIDKIEELDEVPVKTIEHLAGKHLRHHKLATISTIY